MNGLLPLVAAERKTCRVDWLLQHPKLSAMLEKSEIRDALFTALSHLGELLVFKETSSSTSSASSSDPPYFPLCVLDLNWIFRDILPSFFAIRERRASTLSQEAQEQQGSVRFFLCPCCFDAVSPALIFGFPLGASDAWISNLCDNT